MTDEPPPVIPLGPLAELEMNDVGYATLNDPNYRAPKNWTQEEINGSGFPSSSQTNAGTAVGMRNLATYVPRIFWTIFDTNNVGRAAVNELHRIADALESIDRKLGNPRQ